MPKRRSDHDVIQREGAPKRARLEKAKATGNADEDIETTSNSKAAVVRTPRSGRTEDRAQQGHDDTFSLSQQSINTSGQATPAGIRNDRSAHKKSALTLQRTADVDSDDEAAVEDEAIAHAVLNHDDQESSDEDMNEADQVTAETIVKRGRGRPKGSKRKRTPTPPPNLPAHEKYFFLNRPTADKTSTNTLPAHLMLNHDDYQALMKDYIDTHDKHALHLVALHSRSFEQWRFELEEGYNICLYGLGSKRLLMHWFADHVHWTPNTSNMPMLMINGYAYGITLKDILTNVVDIFYTNKTWPTQPASIIEAIHKGLSTTKKEIYVFLNELDSVNLRKQATQAHIAKLVSHPQIHFVCSCDNPNAGLMWDLNLKRLFNFVFHDATTYQPWSVELNPVDEVNSLLGRSSRRLAGKDGVGFVLKSLPENARNLFKLLVKEQIATGLDVDVQDQVEDEDMLGASDEERAIDQQTPSRRGRGRPPKSVAKTLPSASRLAVNAEGVEWRSLYHKAVEAFICSSEVGFRTLLKEFYDHKMVESKKDPMGTERLIVPFRLEELEAILEEL